jgi:hypothetical protein
MVDALRVPSTITQHAAGHRALESTITDQLAETGRLQSLDIPQGEVLRDISGGTMISAGINPNCCVLGIVPQEEELARRFTAGHFQAGEIVRELSELAKIGGGFAVVYQKTVEGTIGDLYTKGQKLTPAQIKVMFRTRDLHHLTNLT